jgi:hypothetical protein
MAKSEEAGAASMDIGKRRVQQHQRRRGASRERRAMGGEGKAR